MAVSSDKLLAPLSSEIETTQKDIDTVNALVVARGAASHLRGASNSFIELLSQRKAVQH